MCSWTGHTRFEDTWSHCANLTCWTCETIGKIKLESCLKDLTTALLHSTAEYCDPAWCRSNHISFINKPIDDALRMVTGCLHPTPTNSLLVLAEKKAADLRQKRATMALANRTKELNY